MAGTSPTQLNPQLVLPHPKARLRALLALFTSAFLFALMGAAAKWTSRSGQHDIALPGPEIAFFRYLSGLIFLGALAAVKGLRLLGNDWRGLLWRGFFGGIASTCFFLGIQFTSLTNATLLNNTFIIWAPLIAIFSLKEVMSRGRVIAVAIALCGVFLVTRPEMGHVRFGDLIALCSGILSGAAIVQVRRLRQGESSFSIFFYFNLLGVPIALLALPLSHTHFVLPTLSQWPLLAAIGASSVSAQLLMTYGYKEISAAQGSLIVLTSVIYSALLAWALFQDPLPPPTLIGGVLIMLSAAGMALEARRKQVRIHSGLHRETE